MISLACIRMGLALGLIGLLAFLGVAPARGQAVSYPALGNVDAAQGTIEMWVRLETEPDGAKEVGHTYFPFWNFSAPRREASAVSLGYQTIWSPQVFHFFFSSNGKIDGRVVANVYVATGEKWTGPGKYPLQIPPGYPPVPRLHRGEWHHLAVIWETARDTTVSLYLDGERVIPPVTLGVPIWDELDDMTFNLPSATHYPTYTIDDLRISSVARTPQEIKTTAAAGTIQADRFTLLLDRFDSLQKIDGVTWTEPQVMCHSKGLPGGRITNPAVESVPGRAGQALRIDRVPNERR